MITFAIYRHSFPEHEPTRPKYTIMLSNLLTELLYWVYRFLSKEHILLLYLICRQTKSVLTEALFRCLMSDKVLSYGGPLSQAD